MIVITKAAAIAGAFIVTYLEMWGLEPQTLYMQSRCSTS